MSLTELFPITRLVSAIRLLIAVFLLTIIPTHAADPWRIDDLAVLVDTSGQESIATVSRSSRAAEFTPAPHGFSAGFTRSVHWLRFTLHAPPIDAQGKREVLLEIHPPYLDDLQIYLSRPEPDRSFEVRRGGDLLPSAEREYPYRAFVYRVAFGDSQPRTAYVRLQTSSSSVMAVRAWEPSRFVASASRGYALLGVVSGFMLAGLLINIWHGLWRNDVLHRRYIVYLTFTMLMLVGINGLVGEFLLPHSPMWAHLWVPVTFLFVIIFGTRFYELALDIAHAAKWMRWLFRFLIWLGIVCLPAPFLDLYPEVAQILYPLLLVTLFAGAWRSIQIWRKNNANGKALLVAHLFSLAGSLSVAPTLLGVFPGQAWLIYSFQIGSVTSLFALHLMLEQHIRAVQSRLTQASIDVEVANATAEQELAEREQQRHFLAMLTHELKTPLSVIRMRLGSTAPSPKMQAHAEQAVEDINAIVDRCATVSQLEDHNDKDTDKANDHERRVSCHIEELLHETLARYTIKPNFALDIDQKTSGKPLYSDPLLLRTILSNLIDNAIKYAPPESTPSIAVSARNAEGRPGVVVRIENPVGIAGKPDASRVFDKYYRASGAHHLSGSGLGLYIVKALAEKLGGTIRYLPQDQQVVFELWLPL